MNEDDWSETTDERDWQTAAITEADLPWTEPANDHWPEQRPTTPPISLEEELDILSDLIATPGLSERDYQLLDQLHHEVCIELSENPPPMTPEEQRQEQVEVAALMAWVENLTKSPPGGATGG